MDINSGTGAMKVTPAYSKIDYEMCQRHGVSDFVECFDDRGRLTLEGFQGYNRATATDKIKAKLEERGLYRCETKVICLYNKMHIYIFIQKVESTGFELVLCLHYSKFKLILILRHIIVS